MADSQRKVESNRLATFIAAVQTPLYFSVSTRHQMFGAAWWTFRWRSFCSITISISICPASRLKVSLNCSAMHDMSTFISTCCFWNEHTRLKLIQVTKLVLKLLPKSVYATLSNASDAEALSFITIYTDGQCNTFFLSKATEKMFILALNAFKATVLPSPCSSQFKLLSFLVMSVKNARLCLVSILQQWGVFPSGLHGISDFTQKWQKMKQNSSPAEPSDFCV